MESYFGHIYLPENDDFQLVKGVQLFKEGEKFWFKAPISREGNEQYNIINGAFTGFGEVTFIECNVIGTTIGCGGDEVNFGINYVISGIHIENEIDLNFSKLSVRMPALKGWLKKTGFKNNLILHKTMSLELPETIILGNFEKFSLEVTFGCNQNWNRETGILLNEYVTLNIKSLNGNSTIWEFLDIYRKFKKFLAFIGVFDKSEDLFFLYDDSFNKENGDFQEAVDFYMKSYNFKDKGLNDIKIPIFIEIENDIEEMLKKWFGSVNLSDSIDLILEKYFQTGLSRETYFLNSCFAIEIYHRRFKKNQRLPKADFKKIKDGIISKLDTPDEINLFENKLAYANEPSFKERLESLKEDFQIILPLTIDMDSYIKQIVNTRNNIVHRSSSKNTLSGLDIYYASVHLEALTKLCIYRELGFSQLHVSKMFVLTRERIDGIYKLNKRLQTGIKKN